MVGPSTTERTLRMLAEQFPELVMEMMEVYEVSAEGKEATHIGLYEDAEIADARVASDTNGDTQQRKVFVLILNKQPFIISTEEVKLVNEREERARLKEVALAMVPEGLRKLL